MRPPDAEAAVLRDPWPDAPRLAFADAIAAADPDRARLVRDEIAVLRVRRTGDPRRLPEQNRLVPLRAKVAIPLAGALSDVLPADRKIGLGRGFVEAVRAPLAHLLRFGEALFARAPILDLHVTDVGGGLADLLAAPWVRGLRSLTLAQNRLDDAAVALLAAAPLSRLCALDLSGNRVGPAGLDALALSPTLPSLRFVALGENPAPDPNYRVEHDGERATGPRPTAESAAFLARHPACKWIGRYSPDDPPMPGALHDADGRPIG